MTHDLARELRQRLTDARALCTALGLHMAPRATARQAHVLCPWHEEKTPSCSVRLAKDGTLSVRCHACGGSADAIGLISKVRGLGDFRAVLEAAAEIAQAPGLVCAAPAGPKKTTASEPQSEEAYDRIWTHVLDECSPMRTVAPSVAGYLTWRGIFADAEAAGVRGLPRRADDLVASLLSIFERAELERAGILREGHDAIDWPTHPVLIPWRDRFGRITCVQRRRLDDAKPKYRSPVGRSPRAPYGVELLADALAHHGRDAEVIITEGALDALARRRIARASRERAAVIGVYSASSPDVGLPNDLIHGRRVVLALDADPAGDAACDKIATALRGVARDFERERPVGAKDWLDALNGGGGVA